MISATLSSSTTAQNLDQCQYNFDQDDAENQYKDDEPQNDVWQAVFDNGDLVQVAPLFRTWRRQPGWLWRELEQDLGHLVRRFGRRMTWELFVGVSSSSVVFAVLAELLCVLLHGQGFVHCVWPEIVRP